MDDSQSKKRISSECIFVSDLMLQPRVKWVQSLIDCRWFSWFHFNFKRIENILYGLTLLSMRLWKLIRWTNSTFIIKLKLTAGTIFLFLTNQHLGDNRFSPDSQQYKGHSSSLAKNMARLITDKNTQQMLCYHPPVCGKLAACLVEMENEQILSHLHILCMTVPHYWTPISYSLQRPKHFLSALCTEEPSLVTQS